MAIGRLFAKEQASGNASPAGEKPASHPVHAQDVPKLASAKSISIIALACLAMITNSLSFGSMNIALPTVGSELGIGDSELQWLQSGFALTSGCFLLTLGRLADIYGRKRAFVCGMTWFIGFTLGCSFAKQGLTLIIVRALAGAGSAATIPSAIGILAKTFPPSRARTVAFATFQAGAPLGGAFSMVLGGVMTEYVPGIGWRAIFYVVAGVGIIVLIGAIFTFPPDDPVSPDQRVDWVGAFLITGGLVMLMFCLGQGQTAPEAWNTPYIIALLVLSLVFILTFIGWEYYIESRTTRPPLMRLDLWTRAKGKFAAVQVLGLLVMAGFAAFSYWATLYYQTYLGLPPIQTTLRFLPSTVTGVLINLVFSFIAGRVSGQLILMVGCLGTGCASMLLALINPDAPYWTFGFPAAILIVFGADLMMSGGSLFGARVALPHEQSLAGGVFNTMCQVGNSFGMTISTLVFDKVVQQRGRERGIIINQSATNAPPDILLDGYRSAQWTLCAFSMFACLVAAITLRGIGVIGGAAKPGKPKTEDGDQTAVQSGDVPSEKHESPEPVIDELALMEHVQVVDTAGGIPPEEV